MVNKTLELARQLYPEFVIDDNNHEAVRLIVAYFGKYPEFEQAGYSLSKGIVLFGQVGSGKTLLMEIMNEIVKSGKKVDKLKFIITSCPEISDTYAARGVLSLQPYGRESFCTQGNGYGTALIRSKPIHRCFDELGMEDPKSNHFGNYRNVMSDIFASRYEMWRKWGLLTHLTTNLSPESIEDIYGDRTRSRLREMCNFIKLTGKDRRK